MNTLLAEEIFKPAAFPSHTYISRKIEGTSFDYEVRLEQSLKTTGMLTSIIGPSKMGKTVLCVKVISQENLVKVNGADLVDKEFWSVLAAEVGLPQSSEKTEVDRKSIKVIESERNHTKTYTIHKDEVIQYFKNNNKVLVLDDFHYAGDSQLQITYQLKDAIWKGLKAIVIALPHRADDAIRKNADLVGRLSLINIEPWKKGELEEIASIGFNTLGVSIDQETIELIAIESLTSPQLMQLICLSICTLQGIDDNKGKRIERDVLEDACKLTALNLDYNDVFKVIKGGPNQRGKARNTFHTKDNKELDLYGLIIQVIKENPPLMRLSIDEIKNRIDAIVDGDNGKALERQKIKDTLNNIQKLLDEQSDYIYKVIEWKDNELHILDPLFLFYLRWNVK